MREQLSSLGGHHNDFYFATLPVFGNDFKCMRLKLKVAFDFSYLKSDFIKSKTSDIIAEV